MQKKVLVDFDGVLVDLMSAIKEQLSKENINFMTENIEKYNFLGDISCKREDVFRAMKMPETYQNLSFYKGAKEALLLLQTHADVYAYTGAVNVPEIIAMREKLVKDLGLKGKVYTSGKPFLEGYDAIFDDCLEVHQIWIDKDIKRFLINQSYNQPENYDFPKSFFNKLTRCDNFNDAVKKYITLS